MNQPAPKFVIKQGLDASSPDRKPHKSAMVSVGVPQSVTARIREAYGHLPGFPRDEDLHCTLVYLGEVSPTKAPTIEMAVESVCKTTRTIVAAVGGVGRFSARNSRGEVPIILTVDCVGLAELRTRLVEALNNAGISVSPEHGFTPHITIGYAPELRPLPRKIVDAPAWVIGQVQVHIGDYWTAYMFNDQSSLMEPTEFFIEDLVKGMNARYLAKVIVTGESQPRYIYDYASMTTTLQNLQKEGKAYTVEHAGMTANASHEAAAAESGHSPIAHAVAEKANEHLLEKHKEAGLDPSKFKPKRAHLYETEFPKQVEASTEKPAADKPPEGAGPGIKAYIPKGKNADVPEVPQDERDALKIHFSRIQNWTPPRFHSKLLAADKGARERLLNDRAEAVKQAKAVIRRAEAVAAGKGLKAEPKAPKGIRLGKKAVKSPEFAGSIDVDLGGQTFELTPEYQGQAWQLMRPHLKDGVTDSQQLGKLLGWKGKDAKQYAPVLREMLRSFEKQGLIAGVTPSAPGKKEAIPMDEQRAQFILRKRSEINQAKAEGTRGDFDYDNLVGAPYELINKIYNIDRQIARATKTGSKGGGYSKSEASALAHISGLPDNGINPHSMPVTYMLQQGWPKEHQDAQGKNVIDGKGWEALMHEWEPVIGKMLTGKNDKRWGKGVLRNLLDKADEARRSGAENDRYASFVDSGEFRKLKDDLKSDLQMKLWELAQDFDPNEQKKAGTGRNFFAEAERRLKGFADDYVEKELSRHEGLSDAHERAVDPDDPNARRELPMESKELQGPEMRQVNEAIGHLQTLLPPKAWRAFLARVALLDPTDDSQRVQHNSETGEVGALKKRQSQLQMHRDEQLKHEKAAEAAGRDIPEDVEAQHLAAHTPKIKEMMSHREAAEKHKAEADKLAQHIPIESPGGVDWHKVAARVKEHYNASREPGVAPLSKFDFGDAKEAYKTALRVLGVKFADPKAEGEKDTEEDERPASQEAMKLKRGQQESIKSGLYLLAQVAAGEKRLPSSSLHKSFAPTREMHALHYLISRPKDSLAKLAKLEAKMRTRRAALRDVHDPVSREHLMRRLLKTHKKLARTRDDHELYKHTVGIALNHGVLKPMVKAIPSGIRQRLQSPLLPDVVRGVHDTVQWIIHRRRTDRIDFLKSVRAAEMAELPAFEVLVPRRVNYVLPTLRKSIFTMLPEKRAALERGAQAVPPKSVKKEVTPSGKTRYDYQPNKGTNTPQAADAGEVDPEDFAMRARITKGVLSKIAMRCKDSGAFAAEMRRTASGFLEKHKIDDEYLKSMHRALLKRAGVFSPNATQATVQDAT